MPKLRQDRPLSVVRDEKPTFRPYVYRGTGEDTLTPPGKGGRPPKQAPTVTGNAGFDARLDQYRDRLNDPALYDEAADVYDPGVPTPLDYREMRDDWPSYPPPAPAAPAPAEPERCDDCGYRKDSPGHRLTCEETPCT